MSATEVASVELLARQLERVVYGEPSLDAGTLRACPGIVALIGQRISIEGLSPELVAETVIRATLEWERASCGTRWSRTLAAGEFLGIRDNNIADPPIPSYEDPSSGLGTKLRRGGYWIKGVSGQPIRSSRGARDHVKKSMKSLIGTVVRFLRDDEAMRKLIQSLERTGSRIPRPRPSRASDECDPLQHAKPGAVAAIGPALIAEGLREWPGARWSLTRKPARKHKRRRLIKRGRKFLTSAAFLQVVALLFCGVAGVAVSYMVRHYSRHTPATMAAHLNGGSPLDVRTRYGIEYDLKVPNVAAASRDLDGRLILDTDNYKGQTKTFSGAIAVTGGTLGAACSGGAVSIDVEANETVSSDFKLTQYHTSEKFSIPMPLGANTVKITEEFVAQNPDCASVTVSLMKPQFTT